MCSCAASINRGGVCRTIRAQLFGETLIFCSLVYAAFYLPCLSKPAPPPVAGTNPCALRTVVARRGGRRRGARNRFAGRNAAGLCAACDIRQGAGGLAALAKAPVARSAYSVCRYHRCAGRRNSGQAGRCRRRCADAAKTLWQATRGIDGVGAAQPRQRPVPASLQCVGSVVRHAGCQPHRRLHRHGRTVWQSRRLRHTGRCCYAGGAYQRQLFGHHGLALV